MIDIENKLNDVLKKSNSLPFLFVGSGMSRRYLNLPDWGGLLKEFLDEDDVEYQIQKSYGNYPKVATYIQEEFLEIFWKSEKYKSMKAEYKKSGLTGDEYSFKFAIAQYFNNIDYYKYQYKEEIEELKKANIDGIITTNYDKFLETLFDVVVYKGQDDLLFKKIMEIGEIYKIHGCCTKFESIVINEKDYKRFQEQSLYLTSKLTSLFVEHPIIFLGYSLSDENIISILKNIASSIGQDKLELLQDRIIFVEYETDKLKQIFESRIKMIDDLKLPITHIKTDDFLSIYKVLSATKRKIPAKCLRMMENSFYELIKTNDPKNKMAVIDIDQIDDYEDIEFYAGIGVISEMSDKGYDGISANDLFDDLILDTNTYKLPRKIIQNVLPQLFTQHSKTTYLPIFKYLKELEITQSNYLKLDEDLHQKIINIIDFDINKYRPKSNLEYFIEDKMFIEKIFKFIVNEEFKEINMRKLQNILQDYKSVLNNKGKVNEKTDYKRLACLYDRLKYGWFND